MLNRTTHSLIRASIHVLTEGLTRLSTCLPLPVYLESVDRMKLCAKPMKIILTLISIFHFSTSVVGNERNLHSDKIIHKHFSDSEINDLELILAFFDNMVINKTGIENLEMAYRQFINTTINDTINRLNRINLYSSFEIDSTIQNELYQEISNETKYKIWCLCTKFEKGGEAYLEIDSKGSYAKVIKRNRKEHPYFKSYYRTLNMAWGTTPSMIMDFGYYVDEINYGKEINRLIFAIHILTLTALKLRIK